jgi:hypothetical protein
MARLPHKLIFFVAGLLLLAINFAGLFVSLRNPAIYAEKKGLSAEHLSLTAAELLRAAERRPGETAEGYVVRLNEAVGKGIAYYWADEGVEKYNLRVPARENYLLFLASYALPRYYRKYEFSDQYKNIERGVGLCSLHATVIDTLLKEHGVDSRVVLLDHHVVAMARVGEAPVRWWIVDPGLGVVVKHDLGEIERDTNLIKPYYLERGYSREYVDWLAGVYGKEGNVVFDGAREYLPRRLRYVERVSYVLKWIIPVILIAPLALSYRRGKYRPAGVSTLGRSRTLRRAAPAGRLFRSIVPAQALSTPRRDHAQIKLLVAFGHLADRPPRDAGARRARALARGVLEQ